MEKTNLYPKLDYYEKLVNNTSRPLLVKENKTLFESGMQSIFPTATKTPTSYVSDTEKMNYINGIEKHFKIQDHTISELNTKKHATALDIERKEQEIKKLIAK